MMHFSAAIVAVLLWAIPARAQLSQVELYRDLSADVSATDEDGPTEADSFRRLPGTESILGLSGSTPWDLHVVNGGDARTAGAIQHLSTTSQIRIAGTFSHVALGVAPNAALASYDAVVSVRFRVSERTPFHVSGFVRTGRALSGPEVVACQLNGQKLAGDDRAQPGPAGTQAFVADREIFPGEEFVLECSAASSGGGGDENETEWEAELEFGATATTTTTTLVPTSTTRPLTRKQCRQSCNRSLRACRQACQGTPPEKRTCRRSCARARKSCGTATACVLPSS